MDDVVIRLQLVAEHPDRRQHSVLPVHVIMLDDRVKKGVLRRDIDLARVEFDLFQIVVVDFVAVLGQFHHAAVVEAGDVPAGDADVSAANAHVAFLFRFGHGVAHAFIDAFQVHDLTFADAQRGRLPDAQHLQRSVGTDIGHRHADFRRADFHADRDVLFTHGFNNSRSAPYIKTIEARKDNRYWTPVGVARGERSAKTAAVCDPCGMTRRRFSQDRVFSPAN